MKASDMKHIPRTRILDVWISGLSMSQALEACETRLADHSGGAVLFVNVHLLGESGKSDSIRQTLNSAFLALPDGMPLVWASSLFGRKIQERTCGPDFMAQALRKWSSIPHGFIGGDEDSMAKVHNSFGVQGFCYSPPFRPFSEKNAKDDWAEFLKRCPSGQPPQVIWVGLGAPKQEQWIHVARQLAPDTLFFGVGAAFDFLSGKTRRAPFWMQHAGLEWLFRLATDPRRLFSRYLVTNTVFIFRVFRQVVCKSGENP